MAVPAVETSRWRVISALGVTQILAWGSTYYLLAVLAAPIVADTGWSLGLVIGGVSLGLLASGLVSICVGGAIERFGGRPVLAASSILIAAGLAALAAAGDVPTYLAAWVVLGIGMGAGLYDAAFSTLGRLFGLDARSAITALTLWGGFASTVCWPLSAALVETFGWRGACLVYAALHLFVALPLHLIALPREPERTPGSRPKPGAEASPTVPRSRAVFLLLAAILTTGGAIAAMISVHLIALLQAGGMSLAVAVGFGALIGPAQVGARVVEMLAGRRLHPLWTLAVAALLICLGLGLLSLDLTLPALALIAYGAGNGVWSIARGALPLTLYGPSGYAVLMGRLAMPSLIAQALTPWLGSLIIARLGASAMLSTITLAAVANLLVIALLWTTIVRT
ncbi:MAG: MFS transporter [Rhodobacteraceae bacterium]|nr:MFS transporter [Paracoccaceae bacterium]